MRKALKSVLATVSAMVMCTGAFTPLGISAADSEYYRDSFEGSDCDWTGRGSATVSACNNAAYQGSGSLFVEGRAENWNGASKALSTDTFVPGEAYSFSVNVMCPNENKENTFHLTLQYNGSDGEAHYDKIASATAYGGEWFQLSNKSFEIPAGATDLSVYVETEKGTSDFYIDDAVGAASGSEIDGAGEPIPATRGDVSCDGVIDVFDVIVARKWYVDGFGKGKASKNADADNNGEVAVNDLVLISQFVMGKIVEFPQGERVEPEKTPFDYNASLQYKAAPDKYINEQAAQQGTIVKETYNGINGQKSLHVYLPYGYDESKHYNIFYIMHGGGENENTIFYDKDAKLGNILDHMIQNGDLEPMIVVTPTFNGGNCTAQNFYNEFRQSVVPFVEGKYSTYAESTSAEDLEASRMHRAYGGFSMGGLSTWCVADHAMDIVGYFMPLSGNNWEGMNTLKGTIDSLGLKQNEYFILAATGSDDIAYPNMLPEMNDLKASTQYFTYT